MSYRHTVIGTIGSGRDFKIADEETLGRIARGRATGKGVKDDARAGLRSGPATTLGHDLRTAER